MSETLTQDSFDKGRSEINALLVDLIPEPLHFIYFKEEKEDKQDTIIVNSPQNEDESIFEKSLIADYNELLNPGILDSVIYRFQNEFHIFSMIVNRPSQKVYSAIRKSDNLLVTITVKRNKNPSDLVGEIPREIYLLKKTEILCGRRYIHATLAPCLGWCKIDETFNYYAVLHSFV